MAGVDRGELAGGSLEGYPSGPAAPIRATARALAAAHDAVALVLVEGISDQIAVETAAAGLGRDLAAERVVVVPVGGAYAVARVLARSDAGGVRVAGLCDRREEGVFRRGLLAARPHARDAVHVCVEDLEDELLRAVGTAAVEELFDAHGDLGAFRSFTNQPAWRGRELDAQMRRFLGSGGRRKLRYARLLAGAAVGRGVLPAPLDALLAGV